METPSIVIASDCYAVFGAIAMKRSVTLVLVFGMFLNSFVALRNIDVAPSDILDNVIAAESSALGFFSAAGLPFRILNSVVRKGATLCDQIKGQPKGRGGDHAPRNSASEYSLNCFESSIRLMNVGKECGNVVFELLALFNVMRADGCCTNALVASLNFIMPFLLVYIVLISRMSIPGWGLQKYVIYEEPGLKNRLGFFMPCLWLILWIQP